MHQLLERAKKFARSSAAVLISGESGTGKELLAKSIHENSERRDAPYLQVNCAALSEQLIESEIFGHVAGAFTGATEARIGRLEAVKSGTLFLDEIGELPLQTQAKFLRILEEKEFQRVGCNQTIHLRGRIVAATNRILNDEVRLGRFRKDLLHRINILSLEVPPLRDRREDIPGLVTYFLNRFQIEGEAKVEKVSTEVMKNLRDYDWPGNIRQLRNTILKSCVLATSSEITEVELPTEAEEESFEASLPEKFYQLPLEEIERQIILIRINRNQGNKAAAAETLGVTPRTLRNKIDRYRKLGYVA